MVRRKKISRNCIVGWTRFLGYNMLSSYNSLFSLLDDKHSYCFNARGRRETLVVNRAKMEEMRMWKHRGYNVSEKVDKNNGLYNSVLHTVGMIGIPVTSMTADPIPLQVLHVDSFSVLLVRSASCYFLYIFRFKNLCWSLFLQVGLICICWQQGLWLAVKQR